MQFVLDNPLIINEEEKNIINTFAKKETVQNLQKEWKETTGESFDTLPTGAATAITSVAFQHGNLAKKAPNFWKQVTNDDWSGAFYNLLDWNGTGKPSQTQTRREKEAKLLEGLFEKRIKKNIGGIVGKAIVKGLTKAGVKRGDTAISTTVGTYKKVNKIFDDANVKTVHDFGSGLGLGSKEFTNKIVTNHEPFVPVEKIIKVKGKVPDYKTADDVIFKEGFASKDGVVNANVLNVIEDPMERSNVVRQIAQLINNKGIAVITTRGSEVTKAAQTSKNATPFNDGWLFTRNFFYSKHIT